MGTRGESVREVVSFVGEISRKGKASTSSVFPQNEYVAESIHGSYVIVKVFSIE